MNKLKKKVKKNGFTLIELMIASMLFSVIMVVGIGAIINVNKIHKNTQALRTVIDNLHFVMEDMSRNLRLGNTYLCGSLTIPANCSDSDSISFKDVDGGDITYAITNDVSGAYFKITKDNGEGPKEITPAEVKIDYLKSGFTVAGYPSNQPMITIRLNGVVSNQGVDSSFNVQTSVSQRTLNIPSS